jgi:transposase
MVAAVRQGQSLRAVARQFGVGVATVACRVQRASSQRLDRVDWSDRPSAPHQTQARERLKLDKDHNPYHRDRAGVWTWLCRWFGSSENRIAV